MIQPVNPFIKHFILIGVSLCVAAVILMGIGFWLHSIVTCMFALCSVGIAAMMYETELYMTFTSGGKKEQRDSNNTKSKHLKLF